MRRAHKDTDIVVISIFVNPTQFGPGEDFKKYPRSFKKDKVLANTVGVDVIYYPDAKDMYPADYSTFVGVQGLTEGLCGASRPGHFTGVTTIVAKLFNAVQPDIAYFGQKDAQQAIVIRKMVKDLNMPLKVKVPAIVREKDGLAISSRNSYLTNSERKDASVLYKSLMEARRLVRKGVKDPSRIKSAIQKMLRSKKKIKIDYIGIVDMKDLKNVKRIRQRTLIALAVRVGKTRLIDNTVV